MVKFRKQTLPNSSRLSRLVAVTVQQAQGRPPLRYAGTVALNLCVCAAAIALCVFFLVAVP